MLHRVLTAFLSFHREERAHYSLAELANYVAMGLGQETSDLYGLDLNKNTSSCTVLNNRGVTCTASASAATGLYDEISLDLGNAGLNKDLNHQEVYAGLIGAFEGVDMSNKPPPGFELHRGSTILKLFGCPDSFQGQMIMKNAADGMSRAGLLKRVVAHPTNYVILSEAKQTDGTIRW